MHSADDDRKEEEGKEKRKEHVKWSDTKDWMAFPFGAGLLACAVYLASA